MDLKFFTILLAILLFKKGDCKRKSGLFGKVSRQTNFQNKMRSNIEFMNEDDDLNGFVIKPEISRIFYGPYSTRYYEVPYRYQMMPIPYSFGFVPNQNWFTKPYLSKDYPNNKEQPVPKPTELSTNQHKHYMERFPESLTYEVTEHINYAAKRTTLVPEDKSEVTTVKPDCFTLQVTDSTLSKDDSLEKNATLNITVETSTLANGPDVMLNDAIHTGVSRSVRKREIKSAVPVGVLFDGTPINETNSNKNISHYLNKIFGNLDQHSLSDMIATLKDEYLTSATSSETKIIEDTFRKLAKSFQSKNKRSKDDSNKNIDDKARAELLAKAAAALGLLTEETDDPAEDSMEDFLEDESYHDIYDHDGQFQSHEIVEDETKEPSFLELLNIATKHKQSKVSKVDPSI